MVYVVGLDRIAAREDSIKLRNQLFVAISRSRGWVHLSGAGMEGSALAGEIRRVLGSEVFSESSLYRAGHAHLYRP